jgi:DNA-binding SARP family transcriptional activator
MYLRLSGQPATEDQEGRVTPLAVRDAALLAWLAVNGPTTRDRLSQLLWPTSDAAQARNSLRQRLFQLKKTLGRDVAAGSPVLALAEGVLHDLAESVELLGELALPDAPEYDDWLRHQRAQRGRREHDALRAQAQALEDAGEFATALPVAQAVLRQEPLSEAAHQRVMRLHYLQGDRASALTAFDACEQMLKDEIGTAPSPSTLELLATIEKSATLPGACAARTLPASMLRPPRMVGRDKELAAARAAWQAGQVVAVSGEAGMGKTRLLQELASTEPGTVVAQARPGDAVVPYSSMARLLWLVAERTAGGSPAAARLLFPADAQGAPLRHPALVRAVVDQLRGAAQRGLRAVVLDDLHFADEASVELLQALASAEAMPDLRLAFASRPAEGPAAATVLSEALLDAQVLAPIPVEALSPAQMQDLVESLALTGIDTALLGAQLHQRTGGNPLFALETLRQGHAQASLGSLRLPTPVSVMRLIQRRLAQLAPQALRLARCAAVAGQDFDIALAAHVLEVPAINLAEAWSELEAAQVLRDLAFAHDLIFEAALASVPAALARHLHAQVAAYLVVKQAEPARIAQHWEQARAWAAAGPAFLQAAERAGLAGRRIESAHLLFDAARCFEHGGDAAARFRALEARAGLLAAHESGDVARLAVADAERAAVTETEQLLAMAARADLSAQRGDADDVLLIAQPGMERARRLNHPLLVFRFALTLCGAHNKAGRAAESVTLLESVQGWVETAATREQQRQYWSALALALDFGHRYVEALRAWQQTRIHAEPLGPDHLAQAINNEAWTLFKMGRATRAAEQGMQGLQLLRTSGDDQRLRVLITQVGVAFFLRHLGRLDDAMTMLEEAIPVFRDHAADYWTSSSEQMLAATYQHLGQPARASALLAPERRGLQPPMTGMRLASRAQLAHATGADGVPLIRQALGLMPGPDHIAYRMASLLASNIVPADEGEALATGVAAWASVRERFGLAMAGHIRAAGCALAQGAAGRALPHIESALHLGAEHFPENLYLPELWLTAAQVFAALGRDGDAGGAVEKGCQWVLATSRQHVPPEFRDSFLRRNPTNAALLALASRQGVPR